MLVDVVQRLTVQSQTVTTTLRPSRILWFNTLRVVYFVELTVPWEGAVDEVNERKRLWYTDMAFEAEQCGWKAIVHPVEVACRVFIATSTIGLLKGLGDDAKVHNW